jgi:L-rhamnose-H+ transport protein
MTTEQMAGFGFLLIGAICGGSFGLPSKYAKKDTPWEVLWGPFFFFVTLLLPLAFGPLFTKQYFAVFQSAGWSALAWPFLFGILWGLGSMTLGMSFAFIGLSLAYALNYGAQIITSSVGTMLIHSPGTFATTHGAVILAGVGVLLLGVVVAGWAAVLKERSLKKDAPEEAPTEPAATKQPKMGTGLVIAIISGVLCACYGIAASFSSPLGATAMNEATFGNSGWQAGWITMSIIVWGGALSACTYCIIQLFRNKTWGHFTKSGIGLTLALALAMAVLHDAAIFFFNVGWGRLGDLGIPVGYPVFMSFAIIVGNIHGFRTGEWKGASKQSIRWIVTGIAILIIGVVVLAQGNAMGERAKKKAQEAEAQKTTQPATAPAPQAAAG